MLYVGHWELEILVSQSMLLPAVRGRLEDDKGLVVPSEMSPSLMGCFSEECQDGDPVLCKEYALRRITKHSSAL